MRKSIFTVALFLISTSSNAALLERLGGLAYYDTALDITWLADANAGAGSVFDNDNPTDGAMTWNNANLWAASITVEGVSGWRLANQDVNRDVIVEDCAASTSEALCLDDEYAHLYFYGGGSTRGYIINSASPAPFANIMNGQYWSGTENELDTTEAYSLDFSDSSGGRGSSPKTSLYYAWAVYDGDVGASVVPVPAAFWLFGSGLVGLIGLARGKANA